MPRNTIARVLSAGLVAAMAALSSPAVFDSMVLSFVYAHYVMSLIYSRRRLGQLLMSPDCRIPLALLTALGVIVTHGRAAAMLFYFGVHHALTETYSVSPSSKLPSARASQAFLSSRFLLNIFVYLVLLRRDPRLDAVHPLVLGVGVGVCFLYWLSCLGPVKHLVEESAFRDALFFEVIGAGLAVCLLFVRIELEHILLYHVVFWILVPFLRPEVIEHRPVSRYFLGTAVVTLCFFLFTPIGGAPWGLYQTPFRDQLTFWGYFHITASFALSSLNPAWVRRWFSVPRTVLASGSADVGMVPVAARSGK